MPFETRLEVIAEPAEHEGHALARSPPARRSLRLAAARRCFLRSQAADGGGCHRSQPAFPGPAVHLGRHVQLRLRLFGFHSDALPPARRADPARCRSAGCLEGRGPGAAAKICKPGDLLFFGSAADHITHTGMYIGEGKFINVTTWIHPVAQICDLGDPHWTRLLVACRRLK